MKIAVKTDRLTNDLLLLSDRTARLAAVDRAFGAWKGRKKNSVKELVAIRKSWDRPLKKRTRS